MIYSSRGLSKETLEEAVKKEFAKEWFDLTLPNGWYISGDMLRRDLPNREGHAWCYLSQYPSQCSTVIAHHWSVEGDITYQEMTNVLLTLAKYLNDSKIVASFTSQIRIDALKGCGWKVVDEVINRRTENKVTFMSIEVPE